MSDLIKEYIIAFYIYGNNKITRTQFCFFINTLNLFVCKLYSFIIDDTNIVK